MGVVSNIFYTYTCDGCGLTIVKETNPGHPVHWVQTPVPVPKTMDTHHRSCSCPETKDKYFCATCRKAPEKQQALGALMMEIR